DPALQAAKDTTADSGQDNFAGRCKAAAVLTDRDKIARPGPDTIVATHLAEGTHPGRPARERLRWRERRTGELSESGSNAAAISCSSSFRLNRHFGTSFSEANSLPFSAENLAD